MPKPYVIPVQRADVPISNRKLFKKLRYIPVDLFTQYITAINGGKLFSLEKIDNDFGEPYLAEKVGLLGHEKSEPYSVGLFSFHENCGLYFITGYSDDDALSYIKQLVKLLGYTGIGGKVSAGYGKFTVEDEICIDSHNDGQTEVLRELLNKTGKFMTLTATLPKDNELDRAMFGCTYNLIRRGGFIQSDEYELPLKKLTQYFFAAGSVFTNRFEGDVYNVANGDHHPVYRYAKPLFIGVDV